MAKNTGISRGKSVQLSGILSGLTSNGELEILSENKQKQTITVGDVHLRPAEPEN